MGLITAEEYTEAIRRETAYTEREAAFLYLAAVHSGAFVTRQYAAFRNTTQGGLVDQFIRKGLIQKHFSSFPTRNKTRVYQVSKPIYGILGEPDNRNRRPKQSALLRLRLMSLDYVLAHPDSCFLTTESDKLEYLTTLGANSSVYPCRTYHGLGRLTAPSIRYFIEKFPMFRQGRGAGFTFLCENSLQTFQTFLDRYLPLLSAIPEAELIYVTTNEPIVKRAREAFHTKLGTRSGAEVDATTLEPEFQERFALECKGFEKASTEELKRLRELRQRKYATFYPTWQTAGMAGIEKLLGTDIKKRCAAVSFTGHILPDHYQFL